MKTSFSSAGWFALNTALVASVLATAVAVVETSHDCRQMYSELQSLEVAQWDMQENWGRLLLEQSTWAAHHRVEQLARKQLGMHLPAPDELRVVAP
jgi:cell division protein FtsL